MSGDVGAASFSITSLHLRHCSFSNTSSYLPKSQLILQPFRCFTYVVGISPTSQLILQPFRRFTYITAHSTTLPPLHLHHSSFSNPYAASSTPQLILQPFRRFTFVTAHSPTRTPLHLRHSSFYNPSAASPMPQVILQLFRCFTYVTGTSGTSSGEPPLHRGIETLISSLSAHCLRKAVNPGSRARTL